MGIQRRKKEAVKVQQVREFGVVTRKRKKRKMLNVDQSYTSLTRRRVTLHEDPNSEEVWTIPKGTKVHVEDIQFDRCFIWADCTYFSKRNCREQTKRVVGWLTFRDAKGWALRVKATYQEDRI